MPPFAECCVIIPCSTIEDFPSRLDSDGARSLLGGLTAAWHPRLIASTRRTPTWHRSDDSPPTNRAFVNDPEPDKNENSQPIRLLIIPDVCVSTLPIELAQSVELDAISHHISLDSEGNGNTPRETRIRVSGRTDAIEKIAATFKMFAAEPPLEAASDTTDFNFRIENSPIDERDFYALGYLWWQTQILTRRLRYTSNLDQIHFENRLTVAAEQYLAGEISQSIDALHDCFDALAEERDHYFSSDPAIIDLTLLTPGTLDDWLAAPPGSTDGSARRESGSTNGSARRESGSTNGSARRESGSTNGSARRESSPQPDLATTGGAAGLPPDDSLPTPTNILVDESVAEAILSGDAQRRERFRARIAPTDPQSTLTPDERSDPPTRVGWCGGGPACDFTFDDHSIAVAEQRIARAIRTVQSSGETELKVYARLGGGIAGEWVPPIAAAGFQGIIPIDFLGGRGFEDESKVILGHGNTEIEALTAKPIDADDDSAFLTLATQLGEAVDRGEIATALLVHWPGGGCDSFHDVRRAASWSLCLGRFWRIDDYFVDGERPFHHGASPKASPAKCETITQLAHRRERLTADLESQYNMNLRGFAALVDPTTLMPLADHNLSATELSERIATALGFDVNADALRSGAASGNELLIHPSHPATRTRTSIAGKVHANTSCVFHAAAAGDHTDLIVDVPAWGFVMVGTDANKQSANEQGAATSPLHKLARWFSGGAPRIVEGNRLSNEFMEVTIHPEHGGLEGVYSGPGRGNRFSTRILLAPSTKINPEGHSDANVTAWRAMCKTMQTITDTRTSAVIELTGDFQRVSTEPDVDAAQPSTPTWRSQYRLDRGSRRLLFRIRFEGADDADLSVAERWKVDPVLRIAIAEANPVVRAILREKLVRTNARSFQSSLGYVIDEGERTTLIASSSATVHRCVGDRFFDTLMAQCPGQASESSSSPGVAIGKTETWSDWQSFSFGFDVRQPVATAKSFAMGDCVCSVPVRVSSPASSSGSSTEVPQRGWLIHPSPLSLDVQIVDVGRVTDEACEFLALQIRVIQTASRTASASLRFCRDVHSAHEVSSLSRPFENQENTRTITKTRLDEISCTDSLQCQDDSVKWSQPTHAVVHLIVLFAIGERA